MNNSWHKNNQTSPGFVYFANNVTPPATNKAENQDFLAFSETQPSPKSSRFDPANYSSPQNFHRGSPRNNYRGRLKTNYSGQSSSPNKNYNSSYNNSWNRFNSNYGFKKHNQNKGDNGSQFDNKYVHPSFMENPWADLESKIT